MFARVVAISISERALSRTPGNDRTRLLKDSLAQDRLDRAFHPFVTLRSHLSGCLAEPGEFLPAMTAGREAMTFAEFAQQPGTPVTAAGYKLMRTSHAPWTSLQDLPKGHLFSE
jgi:hypothetical protein